jgi:hypothetical protein
MEELVLKDRFEEAKSRDLMAEKFRISGPPRTQRHSDVTAGEVPNSTQPPLTSVPVSGGDQQPATMPLGARGSCSRCFTCGMEGHIARSCSYKK